MASPTNQTTVQLTIPPGESQEQYSASLLAQRVLNMEMTPEDTLVSVCGPTPYQEAPYYSVAAKEADVVETTPHSVFHTTLVAGAAPMLLARFGRVLWRHMGGGSSNGAGSWVALVTDLNDDDRARFPDQYLVMNDKVIFTNGVDQAKVISYDNMVVPLGFSATPSTPTALSPSQPIFSEVPRHVPNTLGYSWPGQIGTPGDALDGRTGAILSGEWYYYTQYEDVHGNLSAFSLPSNAARISTMQSDPYDPTTKRKEAGTEIDDLTRSFLVQVAADAPEHTVAIHLYRTPDTKHVSTIPQLLRRVAGSSGFSFGDYNSDASLGKPWEQTVSTPSFKLMCTHQGRLVIANTGAEPGIVRRSQAGFPGTFPEFEFVFPDSGGAEVTGLVSHGGLLLAFTETSLYSLQEFSMPVPMSKGIGCVAPSSIQAMPDGTLVWLGRDGFYALAAGTITRISKPIQQEIRHFINRARMRQASASVDAISGEYRCAIAPAGSNFNELLLIFDGQYWRRQELGYHVADICQTDDWRQYNLFAGRELKPEESREADDITVDLTSNVYVLSRERPDHEFPDRKVRYRSAWIRGDDTALTPLNIRSIYLGMIDAWNGDATIRFYRNGSWDPVTEITDLRLLGVDDESNVVRDIAGEAVLGQAKAHYPRLYWRQVPVDLRNVNTWAFEIEVETPNRLHLAAFAFDMSVATSGSPRGRIPFRADK